MNRIKFFEGGTRSVMVIGNLVFKYPRIHRIIRLLRYFDIRGIFRLFRAAIKANTEEYCCWRTTKASFLAPTYFTLFFLNVQKHIEGPDASEKEIEKALMGICFLNRNGKIIRIVDPHILDRNFKRTKQGYVLIDYSNMPFGLPLVGIIKKRKEKLTKALSFPPD